jgi:hypothetical protein
MLFITNSISEKTEVRKPNQWWKERIPCILSRLPIADFIKPKYNIVQYIYIHTPLYYKFVCRRIKLYKSAW